VSDQDELAAGSALQAKRARLLRQRPERGEVGHRLSDEQRALWFLPLFRASQCRDVLEDSAPTQQPGAAFSHCQSSLSSIPANGCA
jgi:hypothetical protein